MRPNPVLIEPASMFVMKLEDAPPQKLVGLVIIPITKALARNFHRSFYSRT